MASCFDRLTMSGVTRGLAPLTGVSGGVPLIL